MSLAAACGLTLVRSLAVAMLVWPLARLLCVQVKSALDSSRWWIWTAVLAPWFAPELLVGYAYSDFALSLVRFPAGNELAYAGLLTLKAAPVATVLLYFAPPSPLSQAAAYCRRLAVPLRGSRFRRWVEELEFWIRGSGRAILPALAATFLISFQEFEMASRMGAVSWTVWLFDAQAGGLDVIESLKLSLLPLGCELLVLVPLLYRILANADDGAASIEPSSIASSAGTWGVRFYLLAAVVATCVIPSSLVLRDTVKGIRVLLENFTLAREILSGMGFAIVSGLGAWWTSSRILARHHRIRPRLLLICGFGPGLCGPLILGIVFLMVFQLPRVSLLYDTPLVLAASQWLWLLPRAALVQCVLHAAEQGEPVALARLLAVSRQSARQQAGGELVWRLRGAKQFWGVVLLCNWAYWDLTLPSLLAPVDLATAPQRLYNLMHYGQNSVLSAMLCATAVIPLVAAALGHFICRRTLSVN